MKLNWKSDRQKPTNCFVKNHAV